MSIKAQTCPTHGFHGPLPRPPYKKAVDMSDVLVAPNDDARASVASASMADGFPEQNLQQGLGAQQLSSSSADIAVGGAMVSANLIGFDLVGFVFSVGLVLSVLEVG